jgi:hypothetical protein
MKLAPTLIFLIDRRLFTAYIKGAVKGFSTI